LDIRQSSNVHMSEKPYVIEVLVNAMYSGRSRFKSQGRAMDQNALHPKLQQLLCTFFLNSYFVIYAIWLQWSTGRWNYSLP